jgi:hypothetical protein
MNEFYIQSLLNELSIVKKRITRLGVIFYICPILYFLIDSNIQINVALGFMSLENNEIILLMLPSVSIGIYYYLIYSGEKTIEIFTLIEALTPKDKAGQAWLLTMQPEFALSNLFVGLSKSKFSTIFMMIPFLILLVFVPIAFQIYIVVKLLMTSFENGNILYYVLSIITIILVAGVLYYVFNGKNLKDLFETRKQLIGQLNNNK